MSVDVLTTQNQHKFELASKTAWQSRGESWHEQCRVENQSPRPYSRRDHGVLGAFCCGEGEGVDGGND